VAPRRSSTSSRSASRASSTQTPKSPAAYGGGQAWPTTMFFDRDGELANVKLGAYATAELLEQDIRRWALGQGS
jgi:hypothetical protein